MAHALHTALAGQLMARRAGWAEERVAALIKEYGLYPPGDFVRLASGELAVVTSRGPSAHAPMVAAIADRAGLPTVRTTPRDTAQPGCQIAGRATDLQLVLRVVPERLYGLVG